MNLQKFSCIYYVSRFLFFNVLEYQKLILKNGITSNGIAQVQKLTNNMFTSPYSSPHKNPSS